MMEERRKRCRWLHIRLTDQELRKLTEEYSCTTDRNLSDFARRKLLGQPVTVNYRNQSLDGILEELARIRTELNTIGNNFNQAVKKLHTLERTNQVHHWLLTYETQRQQLSKQIELAGRYIKTLAGIWSPE